MDTQVSIPYQDYPTRVRDAVSEKLQGLERYYTRTISLKAILAKDNLDHRVELIANVGNGVTLVVDTRSDALTAAVDDAVRRMGRVLNRHKTKVIGRNRRGGRTGH